MEGQRGIPRQSLWCLIEEQVPRAELPEVRSALGQSLVDMYTEVHSEVDMWLGIWREVKQGVNCGNRPETPRCPLADPPAVKELLRGEVRMLLQSVRERACREGRDGEEAWSRYDPDTVNYALGRSTDSSSRRAPGSRRPPPPGRSVSDELEAVRDQLNVVHIDRVVAHLRCVLTEDCEALKRQVLWLQEDIEQEHRSQCQVKDREPTFIELREQRRVIQMDLDLPIPPLPRSPASSSSSSSVPSSPATIQRFKGSRSPAGPTTPHPRAGTPALRLRPLPSRPHVRPSPPPGSPPARPHCASSVRLRQGSLWPGAGALRPEGLLPRPGQPPRSPAASSAKGGTRGQFSPSGPSVDLRDNDAGVECSVSSVWDSEHPNTHGDQRRRVTDLNVLSMTDAEAQSGTRGDITDGCLYNTMNHHLRSATEVSPTQNDNDNSIVGSETCPMRANRQPSSSVFLTASVQPLPPTVPKLTTGGRHSVRRLSVKQDYNLLRGQKGALHTVNI